MNFDWTTFGLEALNFLVLVWLLKRFLYRPVLAVVEKRRAENEQTIAKAQSMREEALSLKAEYETRLAQAAGERERAVSALDAEIATERALRLTRLDQDLAADRMRRQALAAGERAEREDAGEREAERLAARFASRLLERLAGPQLDALLADVALADLQRADQDQFEALRTALAEPSSQVEVASAHVLASERRAALESALRDIGGRELDVRYAQDPELKAGLRIRVGACVLMANLRDELAFFTTAALRHG